MVLIVLTPTLPSPTCLWHTGEGVEEQIGDANSLPFIHSLVHSLTFEVFIDRSYAERDGDNSDEVPGLGCSLEGKSYKQLILAIEQLSSLPVTVGTQKRETLAGLAEPGKAFKEVMIRQRLEEQSGSFPLRTVGNIAPWQSPSHLSI